MDVFILTMVLFIGGDNGNMELQEISDYETMEGCELAMIETKLTTTDPSKIQGQLFCSPQFYEKGWLASYKRGRDYTWIH